MGPHNVQSQLEENFMPNQCYACTLVRKRERPTCFCSSFSSSSMLPDTRWPDTPTVLELGSKEELAAMFTE
eukprot:854689-Pelagomonas_calceolata.AAC.10